MAAKAWHPAREAMHAFLRQRRSEVSERDSTTGPSRTAAPRPRHQLAGPSHVTPTAPPWWGGSGGPGVGRWGLRRPPRGAPFRLCFPRPLLGGLPGPPERHKRPPPPRRNNHVSPSPPTPATPRTTVVGPPAA